MVEVEAHEGLGHGLDRRLVNGLEVRLTFAGRLPNLRELMPLGVRVDAVGDVGGPGPKEVPAGRRDSVREERSPVVTDEIDGSVELL